MRTSRLLKRPVVLAALLFGLLLPSSAQAVGVDLGLTGGYWFNNSPHFAFDLGVRQPLGQQVSLGLRVGLLFHTSRGPGIGVPLDAVLRVNVQRLYIEGFGGPWFLFGQSNFLRAHVGIGFGLRLRSFSFGVEGGYLQDAALLLARFGFHI